MSSLSLRSLCVWPLLALSWACASVPTPAPSSTASVAAEETVLAPGVRVRRIAPGVWLHITHTPAFPDAPANGLLIEEGATSVLVDTGWDVSQAEHLLTWARDTLHRPVRAAVVTHFHADRTSGIPALTAQRIPVYGLEETARLGASHEQPIPTATFAHALSLAPVELFHPGAAHTPDNLVVWHPASGILFGGCAVKDASAEDLGNTKDADVAAWPASLAAMRERFPAMRTVVPGHGQPGGPELLTHTDALLRTTMP
ncbi:subclass B1 metallo-beta-lactamase [Corallococcus sp. H22C18031201]|uniref:subclass B1 metallo-beta-lactamase n=1 Tax=Citreicoccus inhibens TaxID=2849499 RepID=UPI000E72FB47|nr:subclass B1 metallo-beta-lactamase [Citreicoccus inhibens]MBU8895498.1 subclass B1 metallo-beta-lactamase [Citreicoccus inhibens]RJS22473.1 subclass B1 metallo-beta-lactamase [Corallococcus sp. H22C18031201]